MILKKQIWSLYSAVEICPWNESIDFGFKFESIFWSFLLKWISELHSVFIGSLQMKHADLTETPQEGHKSNNIIYQCFLLLCLFKLYLWLNEISHIWHIKSEFLSVESEILLSILLFWGGETTVVIFLLVYFLPGTGETSMSSFDR